MAKNDAVVFEVSSSESDDDDKSSKNDISERAQILLRKHFGFNKFKSDLQGKAVDTILKSEVTIGFIVILVELSKYSVKSF